jgi:hypothetical protein
MSLSMVLGMPINADFEISARTDGLSDPGCGHERTVAADHEKHADAHALEAVDDGFDDPEGPRDEPRIDAAHIQDLRHRFGTQIHQVMAIVRDEALETVWRMP